MIDRAKKHAKVAKARRMVAGGGQETGAKQIAAKGGRVPTKDRGSPQ